MVKVGSKAQSQIISAVLVILISIGLVSTVVLWGFPLIQKRQDTVILDRVGDNFNAVNSNSLPRKMQNILNSGGTELYTVSTEGAWTVYPYDSSSLENNSLQFSFVSKVSDFADFADVGWIALTEGADCNNLASGLLGTDTSYVVCVKSEVASGGRFKITYRVAFMDLSDQLTGNIYKAQLVQDSSSSVSSHRTIKISRGTSSVQGNAVITQLKVLLQ